jgi:glutamate synthase (NADPH/NADH) large chain
VSAERIADSGAAGHCGRAPSPDPPGLRTTTGLVVETGEAARCTTSAVLAGYGAEAVNPYLAFETLEQMHAERPFARPQAYEAQKNYVKAIGKGM